MRLQILGTSAGYLATGASQSNFIGLVLVMSAKVLLVSNFGLPCW
jgi:hypothetical protein